MRTGARPMVMACALTSPALCAAAIGLAAGAAQAQWTVTYLHPAGASESRALGAWAGQQVGSATYAGAAHAVLWTGSAASFVDLHPAGASASVALASSGARQVGSATIDGASHAALWSGTPASFIDLHPSGPFTVSSAAASAGETQVGSVDASAATWAGSAASFQPLTGLGNPSAALGIRGATIAGYSTVNSVRRAVRFLPGSPELLYDGAGVVGESAALGVGNTAAGYTILDGTARALSWFTVPGYSDLHPPGATGSRALGCFGGRQAGYITTANGDTHAGIWSGSYGSWRDLSLTLPTTWRNSIATALWNDAEFLYVVGYAFNQDPGRTEAIMWTTSLYVPTCYPNCDHSTTPPFLTVIDFGCFLNRYAAGDAYCNCDQSTTPPILTVLDFGCFINAFAAGCS